MSAIATSLTKDKHTGKPLLQLEKGAYRYPLLFMFSMMALGLSFYPAIVIVLGLIFDAWRRDRYDFIIMTMLFCGGFGLISLKWLFVKEYDFALVASFGLLFIMKKPPIVIKTLVWYFLYFLVLVLLARTSWESMSVQFKIMRQYVSFIFFLVPLAAFAGKEFSIDTFFKRIFPYFIIFGVFYLLDALIIKGNVFMPCTYSWYGRESTFWNPIINIFRLAPERKYPAGIIFLALGLYPLSRLYSIKTWQWIVLVGGLFVTQTFTIITGFMIGYVLFQGSVKKIIKLFGGCIIAFGLIFAIDCFLPSKNSEGQSALRIRSSIEQIVDLTSAVDDEDLAEFASGRMAQAIPKLDLVSFYKRQWIGLGFLHQQETHNSKFIIDNEYYSDVTKAEEVATGVEIIPIQVYITIGWIGLIAHVLFFLGLYFFIRKLKYANYYLSLLFIMSWAGLGGFFGLINFVGVGMSAIAYSMVLLANRKELGFRVNKEAVKVA